MGLALVCAVRASFFAAAVKSSKSSKEGVHLQWEEAGPGGEARGGAGAEVDPDTRPRLYVAPPPGGDGRDKERFAPTRRYITLLLYCGALREMMPWYFGPSNSYLGGWLGVLGPIGRWEGRAEPTRR